MRAAAVVNPQAGDGAARRRWPEIARLIEERIGPVECCFTETTGDGKRLAMRLAADGFDTILAAGGDGTLNEVVNGVIGSGRAARIGVVPLASGGDFARGVGLRDPRRAVEALGTGRSRRIDVVKARFATKSGEEERYFINAASVGLGGRVASRLHGRGGLLTGSALYLAVTARELAKGLEFPLRFWADDGAAVECTVCTLALANGRFQGGGILIAPEADLEDGRIDLTVVDQISLPEVVRRIRMLYSGAIYSHPKVKHWRAERVRIESHLGAPVELDGEPVGTLPLTVEVTPRAIEIIC